jgi:acyl-CoA synthetase (AMP-forming)/AMP-acid ligase II
MRTARHPGNASQRIDHPAGLSEYRWMLSVFHPSATVTDARIGACLDHRAISAAAALRAAEFTACGVARGARVVIAHGLGLETLVDLFAAWGCGATAVMAAHTITAGERANVAAATGAAAWAGRDAVPGVPSLPPAALSAPDAPGLAPGLAHGLAHGLPPCAALDDIALIMMTSGTTSKPKGVMLTHRAVQARLALNAAHIGHDLERTLSVLPMHFGHGLIGNVLTPLSAGAALTLWPEPGAAGLPGLGAMIDKHRITFMSSVPSLWRAALKMSPPPAEALRRVHVGSAPLAVPLWEQIIGWAGTRRVLNMYGITETANWIGGHSAEDGLCEDGVVGRCWGGSFALRTEQGVFVREGRGEVAVNAPTVMSGYLDRPDLTEACIKGDWFLTGDIGEIGGDGLLRLVGRTRHEINRGGIKIPAEEIDALLERHPGIAEACAFPLPDPLSGEMVAAAIVAHDGASLDAAEVKAWCETRIRREAVPSRLFILAALPRTDRGKLNRDQVRDACLGGAPA